MVAAIFGAARLRRRYAWATRPEGRAVVVAALVGGILLGPLPVWRFVPGASELGAREHIVTGRAEAAARASP